MSRIKIDLPEQFSFSVNIPVRITDLNYGGHVGNDKILSLLHEARMYFLASLQYTELDFNGASLIMSDVGIQFKSELFYGDELTIYMVAGNLTRAGFDIFYKLIKKPDQLVAIAKTGMVCYDYKLKKVVSIPPEANNKLAESSI